MRIEIDFTKTVQENANRYYGLAKKAKKKLLGVDRGEIELEKKIRAEKVKKTVAKKLVTKRERKWYEKFHWFFTSEGFLVLAGRDAASNEVIVKKLMQKNDLYFHADIYGAAHTIIRCEGKKPSEDSKNEAAVFAAVFSKAWQEQIPAIDVYSVSPEQVSKQAPTGESIGRGAFMIYGERQWYKKTPLEFAVGFKVADSNVEIFSGPPAAVTSKAGYYLHILQGGDSKGAAAKKIINLFSKKLGGQAALNLDDVVSLLPNGGISVSEK